MGRGAALTAVYMFRVVFIAFFGRAHPGGHPHEPDWRMRGPLWLLAGLTVAFGLALLRDAEHQGPAWLMPLSLALALGGIVLAWATYHRGVAYLGGDFTAAVQDGVTIPRRHLAAVDAAIGRLRGWPPPSGRSTSWPADGTGSTPSTTVFIAGSCWPSRA